MSRAWSLSVLLVFSGCIEQNPLFIDSAPTPTLDSSTTIVATTTIVTTTTGTSSPDDSTSTATTAPDASSSGGTTTAESSSTGVLATCGDGVLDYGEQCDDGPSNADEAGCKLDCTSQVCGDGSIGPGEACDDGAGNASDGACRPDCTTQACGDGVVGPGEGCDDGAQNDEHAACKPDCTVQVCGDGSGGPGETCDDGADNADDALCKLDCTLQVCGDGDLGTGEGCDDGNFENGDGCSNVCVLDSCGDGSMQPGEACDDGANVDPDDGCTPVCTIPVCGDAFVQPSLGEQCDVGLGNSNTGGCTKACKAAVCGDGLVRLGLEACDDAAFNGLLGACSATCVAAACGDGVLQRYEGCDDGNAVAGDGCGPDCTPDIELVPSWSHTCARIAGERVRCWGFNMYGQLGYGNTTQLGDQPGEMPTPVVDLGPHSPTSLALSGNSTCAALGDATVRCWGDNTYGQLGINSLVAIANGPGEMPPAAALVGDIVATVVGKHISFCARTVSSSSSVRCWGGNLFGNLGLGSTMNLGDAPGELPYIETPAGIGVELLDVGKNHTCVASSTGVVRCWGSNAYGELGYGDTDRRGDQPGELPTANVDVGGSVVQLALGDSMTCVLLVTGAVRCWGYNGSGQLGYGDTAPRGDQPGELPTPEIDVGGPVVRLGTHRNHVCALMADRKVRCWGWNQYGQLGIGSTVNIGDQPGEMPPAAADLGGNALTIAVGYTHDCALLVGGNVRCWGSNDRGQLGIGSVNHLGDNEAVSSGPFVKVE